MYRRAIDDGDLKLRVWAMVSATLPNLAEVLPAERVVGYGENRLTVRAIKAYSDGALGSRGAWLLDPYEDDPGNTGHNTVPLEDIEAVVRLALQHEYQVGTHAIGDRANQEVLNLYASAFAEMPDAAEDIRFRIEHSQILHPYRRAALSPTSESWRPCRGSTRSRTAPGPRTDSASSAHSTEPTNSAISSIPGPP